MAQPPWMCPVAQHTARAARAPVLGCGGSAPRLRRWAGARAARRTRGPARRSQNVDAGATIVVANAPHFWTNMYGARVHLRQEGRPNMRTIKLVVVLALLLAFAVPAAYAFAASDEGTQDV